MSRMLLTLLAQKKHGYLNEIVGLQPAPKLCISTQELSFPRLLGIFGNLSVPNLGDISCLRLSVLY